MRKVILVLMLLLLLGSCTKGVEVEDKLRQYEGLPKKEVSPVVETDVEDAVSLFEEVPEDSSEVSENETLEEVDTEDLPTFEEPEAGSTCTTDSKGVVRVEDSKGNKKVYRHDCTNGLLIKYSCEEGDVKEDVVICSSGKCLQGPYGDKCAL